MVHFHNFLTYLTLVLIDIVIASAGPGKVSCADNGQLGIFVAHFCNFLPQCCAAKNCFLVWKSVKGNQERTETTLFANAKVQSISRTRCTSFCVVLCRNSRVFLLCQIWIVKYCVKYSTVDCKYLLFLQDFFFRLKSKQYKNANTYCRLFKKTFGNS